MKLEIVVLAKGKAKKRTFDVSDWHNMMIFFEWLRLELQKESVDKITIKKV